MCSAPGSSANSPPAGRDRQLLVAVVEEVDAPRATTPSASNCPRTADPAPSAPRTTSAVAAPCPAASRRPSARSASRARPAGARTRPSPRERPRRVDSSALFSAPRLIELIARSPDARVRLEVQRPGDRVDHPALHRQRVRHHLVDQADPAQRVQAALGDRQVDRPPAFRRDRSRGSGRRSYSVTCSTHAGPGSTPAGFRSARPDDRDLSCIGTASARRGRGAPAVVVRRVQRHRREPQYVGLPRVGDHAVLEPQPPRQLTGRIAADPQRQLRATSRRVGRRDHLQRPAASTPAAPPGTPSAADCAPAGPRCRPCRRSPATSGPGSSRRSAGSTPARRPRTAGGRDSGVISNRVDASVLHQPSNRGRSPAQVPLVHEGAGERARAPS